MLCRYSILETLLSKIFDRYSVMFHEKIKIQGCRISGSGGARAPPVFKMAKILSHKNAIKPPKNAFYRGLCTPRYPRHPQFSRGCDSPELKCLCHFRQLIIETGLSQPLENWVCLEFLGVHRALQQVFFGGFIAFLCDNVLTILKTGGARHHCIDKLRLIILSSATYVLTFLN